MGHSDHTAATGAGGVMLIRVADASGTPGVIGGNEIQFHIRAGLSGTWVGSPGFRWDGYINGGWGPNWRGHIGNINGTGWRHVATFYIGSSQSVCFRIERSGTQGFGGPTDFWLAVDRTPPPPAPKPPNPPTNLRLRAGTLGHQTFGVDYNRGSTNGAAITADIAEWATDAQFRNIVWQDGTGVPGQPGPAGYTSPNNGTSPRAPLLKPGVEYFVRVKSDAYGVGWSGWSPTFSTRTLAGIRVKVNGVWRDAIPMVKVNGVWRDVVPYSKVNGQWKTLG